MNSAHSRCSTFRNSARSDRRRKAVPPHDADMSTRHCVIPVANFAPDTDQTMNALPLRESDVDDNPRHVDGPLWEENNRNA